MSLTTHGWPQLLAGRALRALAKTSLVKSHTLRLCDEWSHTLNPWVIPHPEPSENLYSPLKSPNPVRNDHFSKSMSVSYIISNTAGYILHPKPEALTR